MHFRENVEISYNSSVTEGTFIFDGTETQKVHVYNAYNVVVLNPKGITGSSTENTTYTGYIYLYGHMDLHGHPISDFNIYMRGEAMVAEGSDYGKLIIDTSFTLRSNIPSDIYIAYTGTLNIPSGSSYVIDGNVSWLSSYNDGKIKIEEDAVLTINGGLSFSSGEIVNNGTLICNGENNFATVKNNETVIVNGNFNGTVTQTLETAEMHFRENVEISYNSSVTEGTFIFDGTETQKVHVYNAYNVEVLNPEGIKYLSNVNVYGNFDVHKNPIDMGSYKTNFYDGGGFGTLSENQSDWIIGVQPTYTTVGERYKECLVCGEKICTEEIPVLTEPLPGECEHIFGEWIQTVAPGFETKGEERRDCVNCDHYETREVETLGYLQEFVQAVKNLSNNESVENTYSELYSALQLYSKLTDDEKQETAEEFLVLKAAINTYNSKAETANTELKNATEIAFVPISASFTFLAALLFLLKRKFWIK